METFSVEDRRENRRSSRNKNRFGGCLLICSSLLFAGFTLIIILFSLSNRNSAIYENDKMSIHRTSASFSDDEMVCEEDLCLTKECISIASRILNYMDNSVDPCEDFYSFACGNYQMHKYARYGEDKYDVYNEAMDNIVVQIKKLFSNPNKVERSDSFKKANLLYESCMNTDSREQSHQSDLRYFFSDIGMHWPILEIDDVDNISISWTQVLSQMIKHGFNTLIKPSFANRDGKITLTIECHMPVLPIQTYLNPSSEESRLQMRYYRTVMLLIFDMYGLERSDGKKMFEDVIELETEIAELSMVSEGRYFSEENVEQLKDLFANLLRKKGSDIEVISLCKGKLENTFAVMNRSPKKSTLNYIGWRAVLHLFQFLGKQHKSLYNRYVNLLIEGHVLAPGTWRECSELIYREMGLVAAKAIIEKGYINHDQYGEVYKRFHDVKRIFMLNLENISWIDNATANGFIDKLSKMTLKIGAVNIFDRKVQQDINDMFKHLALNEKESFMKNMLRLRIFKVSKYWSSLSGGTMSLQSVSQGLINYSPLETSAHYYYNMNQVEMSYDFLVSPLLYFGANMPRYLENGQNIILARLISHALDMKGLKYDGNEKTTEVDLLPMSLKEKFNAFISCLSNHFPNALNHEEINNVIADLGSFHFTFTALQSHVMSENMTDDSLLPGVYLKKQQVYLVQAVQMFCEVQEKPTMNFYITKSREQKKRINNAVANAVENFQHFGCVSGSKMNPLRKCNLLS